MGPLLLLPRLVKVQVRPVNGFVMGVGVSVFFCRVISSLPQVAPPDSLSNWEHQYLFGHRDELHRPLIQTLSYLFSFLTDQGMIHQRRQALRAGRPRSFSTSFIAIVLLWCLVLRLSPSSWNRHSSTARPRGDGVSRLEYSTWNPHPPRACTDPEQQDSNGSRQIDGSSS